MTQFIQIIAYLFGRSVIIGIFSGSTSEHPSAQTVGKYTIRFTPTANDTRLAIPSGMAISELSVEAADTYDAALGGGGLPGFFSGDTMPRD